MDGNIRTILRQPRWAAELCPAIPARSNAGMGSVDVFILLERADEIRRQVGEAMSVHRHLMRERRKMIRHAKQIVVDLRSTAETARQAAKAGALAGAGHFQRRT